MKKLLMLLTICLALLCLCLPALAEVEIEIVDANYIRLPQEGGMKMRFRNTDKWTFVTNDNLDEHIDRVLSRGGTEEAIRERYARDTFLFEAYSEYLPADACIRVELFEDDLTREAWHAQYLDWTKSQEFFGEMANGMYIPWYDIFMGRSGQKDNNAGGTASFTNTPPHALESGTMAVRLINGRMYLVSYNVYGRFACLTNQVTAEDKKALDYAPNNLKILFDEKALPPMPEFELEEEFPIQADVGDMTVKGTVKKNANLTVTLDGEEIPVELDKKKGEFTVVLPLTEEGDREVVFTATRNDCTDRVERYSINVSSTRTKLHFTEIPQDVVRTGDVKVAGESDPGATISLTLDEGEPVLVTADETGKFAHTFNIKERDLHHLFIMATAPDYKDTFKAETWFITEFEEVIDGQLAFHEKTQGLRLVDVIADPEAYQGRHIIVTIHMDRVDILEGGLGILCKEYFNDIEKSYGFYKGPLNYCYVEFEGYAHGEPRKNMVLEVYGIVNGTYEHEGQLLPRIEMQFGVYRY